jgi:hypothetical protein
MNPAALAWLVNALALCNGLGALGALALPPVVRRLKGPLAASLTSKLCTGAAIGGAIAVIVAIRLAEIPDTRAYIIAAVPLAVLSGATCVYWTVIGLLHSKRSDLERAIKERERRSRERRLEK